MNLINKIVEHKVFGTGKIVGISDNMIIVDFNSVIKKFVNPDAFGTYLRLVDNESARYINKLKKDRKDKERREALETERKRARQLRKKLVLLQREKLIKRMKIHPAAQAAFWCRQNELDEVFSDWKAFTGLVKSGFYDGEPKRPTRLHQNSACIITVREPDMKERDRFIAGVYMVNEAFLGKLCDDGYVPAHSKYRIRLSEEESKRVLFWNYYKNKKFSANMTWNSGRYRYFDNIWMAQILRDIVALKKDPAEKELAAEFLNYFCDINKLDGDLPEPDGALKQA
jgi:hypothetical protein